MPVIKALVMSPPPVPGASFAGHKPDAPAREVHASLARRVCVPRPARRSVRALMEPLPATVQVFPRKGIPAAAPVIRKYVGRRAASSAAGANRPRMRGQLPGEARQEFPKKISFSLTLPFGVITLEASHDEPAGQADQAVLQENLTVTKKEIVKQISDRLGLTQLKTKEIVQLTFDAIVDTLIEDSRIELR